MLVVVSVEVAETAITNGKSSGVAREAELLGRDKTIDLWVRNSDVQVGIFAGLLAGEALPELPDDEPPKQLPAKEQ